MGIFVYQIPFVLTYVFKHVAWSKNLVVDFNCLSEQMAKVDVYENTVIIKDKSYNNVKPEPKIFIQIYRT